MAPSSKSLRRGIKPQHQSAAARKAINPVAHSSAATLPDAAGHHLHSASGMKLQRRAPYVPAELPGHKLRRRSREYRKISLWLRRRQHRWRDRSLTLLLIVQLTTIFGIVPLAASGLRLPSGLPLLLLCLFMSVTIVMARGTWAIGVGLGTFVANAALATWRRSHGGLTADMLVDVSALLTFTVLSGLVGTAVFRPGRVNSHRIRGALVLYLNLGLLFALLHRMVAEFIPGAYTHLPDPGEAAAFRATLDYYSFSTLTSVGYGDIVPVHPIARSLAALEACAGQLLPTVLIGRVVMLAMRD